MHELMHHDLFDLRRAKEWTEALADCGCTRADVKLSVDRLVEKGRALVQVVNKWDLAEREVAPGDVRQTQLTINGKTIGTIHGPVTFVPGAPLWGGIFWSAVFALVNAVMIARIMADRTAFRMSQEERQLFELLGTLSPGEFRRLVKAGDWLTVTPSYAYTLVEAEGNIPIPTLLAGSAYYDLGPDRRQNLQPFAWRGFGIVLKDKDVVFHAVTRRNMDTAGSLIKRHVVGQNADRIALYERMPEYGALKQVARKGGDDFGIGPAAFVRRSFQQVLRDDVDFASYIHCYVFKFRMKGDSHIGW